MSNKDFLDYHAILDMSIKELQWHHSKGRCKGLCQTIIACYYEYFSAETSIQLIHKTELMQKFLATEPFGIFRDSEQLHWWPLTLDYVQERIDHLTCFQIKLRENVTH